MPRNERKHTQAGNLVQFGARLRDLRKDRGLSQLNLAHASGLTTPVISELERGLRDVSLSALWPLAEALGVQVRDLFPESSG